MISELTLKYSYNGHQTGSKLKHPIPIPISQNHNLQELLNNYQTIFCGTIPNNYQTTTHQLSLTNLLEGHIIKVIEGRLANMQWPMGDIMCQYDRNMMPISANIMPLCSMHLIQFMTGPHSWRQI